MRELTEEEVQMMYLLVQKEQELINEKFKEGIPPDSAKALRERYNDLETIRLKLDEGNNGA